MSWDGSYSAQTSFLSLVLSFSLKGVKGVPYVLEVKESLGVCEASGYGAL